MYVGTTRSDIEAIDTLSDAVALLERQELIDYSGDDVRENALQAASSVLSTFVPETVDDAQAMVAMIERLVPDWSAEERFYEGYCGVICSTPASFAFQCVTHFAVEGMDEDEAEVYADKVRSLFETAYPVGN